MLFQSLKLSPLECYENGILHSACFRILVNPYPTPRLNIELDLQSLFGLLCTAVLIG
jgi:hypothetical protein